MISPTNTISPEWENENALRAYPLVDDAKAASVIPSWLIADMHVTVDRSYDTVFVSSVYVSGTILSLSVSGVLPSGKVIGLLAKTVTVDELEPYMTYSMDRLTGMASGSIAFGEPPQGFSYVRSTFSSANAKIVASAVTRITVPGVTRIFDKDHNAYAEGIIDLSGNDEFTTYVDPDDKTGQTIVIKLTDMYRDMTTSVCNLSPSFDACGRIPVKTINGVAPNDSGLITFKFR